MKKIALVFYGLIILFSCKTKGEKGLKDESKNDTIVKPTYLEEQLALNKQYDIGDVRRYGMFPDSAYAYRHPLTNNPKITDVIDLAENEKIELYFPKGYYGVPLILDSREGIKIKSNKAIFDIIHITKDPILKKEPKDIQIKGSIISFDRLGITEANNIKIDSVFIISDTIKSARKMRARGCHIYYGSQNISIKYLQINDFGSGDVRYDSNHAALAVDGWGNQPKNVNIDKVYIKSTDRHGVYLTGYNHFIGEIVVDKFGVGTDKDMTAMQDADVNEEKLFAAIWINRCYDSYIKKITINNLNSKGYFSTNFDEGDVTKPVNIEYLEVKNLKRVLPIYFADNTGVKVLEIKK